MILSRNNAITTAPGGIERRFHVTSLARRHTAALAIVLFSCLSTGCANTPARTVANYILTGNSGYPKDNQVLYPFVGYPTYLAASGLAAVIGDIGRPAPEYDYQAWAKARHELAVKDRERREVPSVPAYP